MSRRAGAALAAAAMLVVLTACGPFGDPGADRACGQAVLSDWADGRIDKTYADPCYEAAIDVMPEDLRAYTTAKDDISRALYAHRDGS